jgi:hypothetical protein
MLIKRIISSFVIALCIATLAYTIQHRNDFQTRAEKFMQNILPFESSKNRSIREIIEDLKEEMENSSIPLNTKIKNMHHLTDELNLKLGAISKQALQFTEIDDSIENTVSSVNNLLQAILCYQTAELLASAGAEENIVLKYYYNADDFLAKSFSALSLLVKQNPKYASELQSVASFFSVRVARSIAARNITSKA